MISLFKKHPILYLPLHAAILIGVHVLLSHAGILKSISNEMQLIGYDGNWYNGIRLEGIRYLPEAQSNAGFFPLYPHLWKWSGLGPGAICVLQFVLVGICLSWLIRKFELPSWYLPLGLCLPPMFFFYVTYTEALFFIFSTLFLAGIHLEKKWLSLSGLFLASMTRPTAIFFIPGIIFSEIFTMEKNRSGLKKAVLNSGWGMLACLAGLGMVILWQFAETGVWFAYFKAQSEHWHHHFQLPHFPFGTWDGTRLLWLDGLGILFALLALGVLLISGLKGILKKNEPQGGKVFLFSCAYLVLAGASIFFFNPFDGKGVTTILSANRYLLANVFLLCFLFFLPKQKFSLTELAFLVLMVVIGFGMLGVFQNLYDRGGTQSRTYFFLIFLTFLGILFMKNKSSAWLAPATYLYCLCMQVILFDAFVNGMWVG